MGTGMIKRPVALVLKLQGLDVTAFWTPTMRPAQPSCRIDLGK
jgi:hypothetical protein